MRTDYKSDIKAIIIGAGPAGLTAAYELLRHSSISPVVVEECGQVGGISKTLNYNGNRIDLGGHRFFSKNEQVMQWWHDMLPLQGKPSCDDILLERQKDLKEGGPDPENDDYVMLIRQRVSRIYFLRKFFKYPVSLSWQTIKNMGIANTVKVTMGYLFSACFKRKEKSLEDFFINRFGKPLYRMFFEDYTKKMWGLHPSELDANWGAQRVKGLSLMSFLRSIFKKSSDIYQKNLETSLIEQFIYPKYGPGQLWETVADKVREMGGDIRLDCRVTQINTHNGRVVSVDVEQGNTTDTIECDYVLSSMPMKDLTAALRGIEIPEMINNIAKNLLYRDFITVGLLVDSLQIVNQTNMKTVNNIIPDTWLYIQESYVKIGRIQVFNNWSPYMVKDYRNTVWLGLEYFCTQGDDLWNMPDDTFINMAIDELVKMQIIRKDAVKDAVRIKVKKAYPVYYGAYRDIDKLINFLDGVENLYCIGRNGQHRYNNMDHSMLTAMAAVDSIINNACKQKIWKINTEKDYLEKVSNN